MWSATTILNSTSPWYSTLMGPGFGPGLDSFFLRALQVILRCSSRMEGMTVFLEECVSHTPWWWKSASLAAQRRRSPDSTGLLNPTDKSQDRPGSPSACCSLSHAFPVSPTFLKPRASQGSLQWPAATRYFLPPVLLFLSLSLSIAKVRCPLSTVMKLTLQHIHNLEISTILVILFLWLNY